MVVADRMAKANPAEVLEALLPSGSSLSKAEACRLADEIRLTGAYLQKRLKRRIATETAIARWKMPNDPSSPAAVGGKKRDEH